MGLGTTELRTLLDFATHVANVGGQVAMRHYRGAATDSWRKDDGTLVTRADIAVEEAIVAELMRADRHAEILGEELGGAQEGMPGLQWVIDPIDGTSWYALGLPIFGVLLALLLDREPVLGIIHCPALSETVSAATGLGCWVHKGADRAVAAHVATCESIDRATVSIAGLTATELAGSPDRVRARIAPLIRLGGRLVTAGDCVQHALVATGKLHIAIDPVMRPWDSAAIIPCIREAGGAIGCLGEAGVPLAFAGSLISAVDENLLKLARRVVEAPA